METSDYKEFIFKALIRKQDALGSSEVQAGSVTGTFGELRATQAPRLSRWLLLLNEPPLFSDFKQLLAVSKSVLGISALF